MTNCSVRLNVTLDRIPVASGGYWRQNAVSFKVRKCNPKYPEACRGGDVAGDMSCAPGHRGPLCELCVQEPLHYGGRGSACQLCSEAGDVGVTVGLGLSVFFGVVLVTIIFLIYSRRRRLWPTLSMAAASPPMSPKTRKRVQRCKALGESLMIKVKILISLWQVIISSPFARLVSSRLLSYHLLSSLAGALPARRSLPDAVPGHLPDGIRMVQHILSVAQYHPLWVPFPATRQFLL